jgi:hypothetical protein
LRFETPRSICSERLTREHLTYFVGPRGCPFLMYAAKVDVILIATFNDKVFCASKHFLNLTLCVFWGDVRTSQIFLDFLILHSSAIRRVARSKLGCFWRKCRKNIHVIIKTSCEAIWIRFGEFYAIYSLTLRTTPRKLISVIHDLTQASSARYHLQS